MINVHKYHQEIHVLKGINLHVKQGETFVIVGRDGAGISTLIRCLYQLETPDEGEIWLADKRLAETSIEIGAVFQHLTLFPQKTVIENLVELYTVMQKRTREAAILEAKWLLRKVGMLDYAYVYPLKLSTGQKRRVAIAQALALKPTLLLCDNPTGALDADESNTVLQIISALKRSGITMIIGTKKMAVAHELGNQIFLLEDGILKERPSANNDR